MNRIEPGAEALTHALIEKLSGFSGYGSGM
jgi:hypothetical protein